MAIHFNHTILSTHDSKASGTFLAEMLGLPAPRQWGPFYMVTTENGANLDYMDVEGDIIPQHYAFLTSESEFDEIFGRIGERSFPTGPIPHKPNPAKINHHDGGRGIYFKERTDICSKSLPANTAAAAGILDGRICGRGGKRYNGFIGHPLSSPGVPWYSVTDHDHPSDRPLSRPAACAPGAARDRV